LEKLLAACSGCAAMERRCTLPPLRPPEPGQAPLFSETCEVLAAALIGTSGEEVVGRGFDRHGQEVHLGAMDGDVEAAPSPHTELLPASGCASFSDVLGLEAELIELHAQRGSIDGPATQELLESEIDDLHREPGLCMHASCCVVAVPCAPECPGPAAFSAARRIQAFTRGWLARSRVVRHASREAKNLRSIVASYERHVLPQLVTSRAVLHHELKDALAGRMAVEVELAEAKAENTMLRTQLQASRLPLWGETHRKSASPPLAPSPPAGLLDSSGGRMEADAAAGAC